MTFYIKLVMKSIKMKSLKVLIFIFFLPASFSYGQSGYLGSLDAVELQLNMSPSFLRTNRVIDNGADSILSSRIRYIYPRIQLNYARVLRRNLEVITGYNYARIKLITTSSSPVSFSNTGAFNIFEDLRANRHGGQIQLRYYRKGSIAPIGKYLGLSLSLDFIKLASNQVLNFGSVEGTVPNTSGLNLQRFIISTETPTDDFENIQARSVIFNFVLGRNYPITDKIMLSTSATFPLVSSFRSANGNQAFGLQFLFNNSSIDIRDGNLAETIIFSSYKYSRISGNIGIRYQL